MEILVFPMEEQELEKTDIELAVQSLIGAIPAIDMSLEEMRKSKYYIRRMKRTLSGSILFSARSIGSRENAMVIPERRSRKQSVSVRTATC